MLKMQGLGGQGGWGFDDKASQEQQELDPSLDHAAARLRKHKDIVRCHVVWLKDTFKHEKQLRRGKKYSMLYLPL